MFTTVFLACLLALFVMQCVWGVIAAIGTRMWLKAMNKPEASAPAEETK